MNTDKKQHSIVKLYSDLARICPTYEDMSKPNYKLTETVIKKIRKRVKKFLRLKSFNWLQDDIDDECGFYLTLASNVQDDWSHHEIPLISISGATGAPILAAILKESESVMISMTLEALVEDLTGLTVNIDGDDWTKAVIEAETLITEHMKSSTQQQ